MSTPYFLAKRGKIFGPFTSTQIQEMKAADSLLDYSFIWNPQKQEWLQLDTPPAAPQLPNEKSVEDLIADLKPPTLTSSIPERNGNSSRTSFQQSSPVEVETQKSRLRAVGKGKVWKEVLCYSLVAQNQPANAISQTHLGELSYCGQDGGVLVLERGSHEDSVPYFENERLALSILENIDARTEKSHLVHALVNKAVKTKSGWEVHLRWQGAQPSILSA